MRIVGGKFRGQRLVAPKGLSTRPTTDRTRESLFNILGNIVNFDRLRVLDLFAGTGALGFEALSRGAEFCLFVEEASQPRAAIRSNIEALRQTGTTKLFKRDATRLGGLGTMEPFDVAFADPPYSKGLGERAAKSLLENGWLKPTALFVLEENKQSFPESLNGFELYDMRQFGDTSIGMFHLAG